MTPPVPMPDGPAPWLVPFDGERARGYYYALVARVRAGECVSPVEWAQARADFGRAVRAEELQK